MKKQKSLILIAPLFCLAFSCFYGCTDPQEEEDKTPLLQGTWSFDPAGTSTKISINESSAQFVAFAGDKWQTMADERSLRQWDDYFTGLDFRGGNKFKCLYWLRDGSRTTREVSLDLAADGKTFTVQTGDGEETWYKQSSEPVLRGYLSFWTDKGDRGYLSIELYDSSYDFGYYPVDGGGYFDPEKLAEYQAEHLIGIKSLYTYFPSGIPGCGQNGTTGFDLAYGRYKYSAGSPSYGSPKQGIVYVNKECVMVKL